MNIPLNPNDTSLQNHEEDNSIYFPALMSCIGMVLINKNKRLTFFLHVNCGHFYKEGDSQDVAFRLFITKHCEPSDSLMCLFTFNNSTYENKEAYGIVKDFVFEVSQKLPVETIVLCNEFSHLLSFNSRGQIKNFMSKRDPTRFQELKFKNLIEDKARNINNNKTYIDDQSCFSKCNIF